MYVYVCTHICNLHAYTCRPPALARASRLPAGPVGLKLTIYLTPSGLRG